MTEQPEDLAAWFPREPEPEPAQQLGLVVGGSLSKGLDVRLVFPGHGEYIEDLQAIIATYREHHRERMDKVWEALKRKPRPLYHLIDDVFTHVPEYDVFLAISEIFVHLEILIDEGRAELADPGPPALYRAL